VAARAAADRGGLVSEPGQTAPKLPDRTRLMCDGLEAFFASRLASGFEQRIARGGAALAVQCQLGPFVGLLLGVRRRSPGKALVSSWVLVLENDLRGPWIRLGRG